jgi:hypothetical protein
MRAIWLLLPAVALATGCPAFVEDTYVVGQLGVTGGAGEAGTPSMSIPGGAAGAEPTGGTGGVATGGTGGVVTGGTGGVATGGTGGVATGGAGGVVVGTTSLIDDFEDQDLNILVSAGRSGYWFDFDDGTGTQSVAVSSGSPTGGQYVLCATGNGFSSWGAGFGANLNAPAGYSGPYDASAYRGVTFWLQVAAGTNSSFRISLPDSDTSTAAFCTHCNNHMGVDFTALPGWNPYTFLFSEMTQSEPTVPVGTLHTAAIYTVQIEVTAGAGFNYCVDDVAFFE